MTNEYLSDVSEKLQYLILEVIKQVKDSHDVLLSEKTSLADKIVKRDDYIDNLKSGIENKCFKHLGLKKINAVRPVVSI